MLPSEQSLGWKLHPCTGMHESTVQGLPSLQVMAMLWHVPCSQESVVQAVKRLSETYPMLDKGKMLGETADLVAQHIVQGRDAAEVIDELERVFRRFYDELMAGRE